MKIWPISKAVTGIRSPCFLKAIDDYITEDNEVRVIEAYVNSLDLNKLGFTKATFKSTGRPPYDPKDLLKLYLYGYLNRIRSSRRLEAEATRNIEVIWLLRKLRPDFKTIADFRKDNKKALKNIFRDFNKLLEKWDLFGKELIAIDSSKFRAQNSKKNNYNAKKIDRHLKYIDQKIDRYLEELDEEDEKEKGVRKVSKKEIDKRIKELQERKMKYESYQKELQENNKKEISTTDADARLMSNNNNGVEVSYNVQTTVDAKNKLILDFKVTSHPNDLGELDNMALRAKKLFKGKSFTVLADKGYYKKEDLKKCLKEEIIPYVAKQSYANGPGKKEFYGENFSYDKERNIYICP